MPNDPDLFTYLSLCLSEVLSDIGLNEDMVIKERRTYLLRESLVTLAHRLNGEQITVYIFGSRTEGTTTGGLNSDVDFLKNFDINEAVTDLIDCKPGKVNIMMHDDETTSPGYCLLKAMVTDPSISLTILHDKSTSNWVQTNDDFKQVRHGPAVMLKGHDGYNDIDYVLPCYCKTWPLSARAWLSEEGIGRWPTKEMKAFAVENGCFLVGIASKGSEGTEREKYEFRISTSKAERCLMFSLNITQIQCYVLMKMIIKAFERKHPNANGVISSYMCKSVLFHCIRHSYSSLWKEPKLLYCLTFCLASLQYCVLIGNCPHFIIHANNLMAERITTEFKTVFLKHMRDIILDSESFLQDMKCDYLGLRIQAKMKGIQSLLSEYQRAYNSGIRMRDTGKCIQDSHHMIVFPKRLKKVYITLSYVRQCISTLIRYHRDGSKVERAACQMLAVALCSTLGSLIASCSISSTSSVSPEAVSWFDVSLESDVSSSRLKKASAFFSAGDMITTYSIIEDIWTRYDLKVVEPVCRCTYERSHPAREGFDKIAQRYNEKGLEYAAAFCVMFLRCEKHCVPKELQYEMYRTTAAERPSRHPNNRWLDVAFIDSLTFLLFLRYKTCGRLGKHKEQKQALENIMTAIFQEPNLGHRETALNLVGQILEEEGKISNALACFLKSFDYRPKFNAAKIHVCRVLSKMLKR